MKLRPHRRNLVAWSTSVGLAGQYGAPRFTRPTRTGRIRRCIRTGALLTVIGLMRLARAGEPAGGPCWPGWCSRRRPHAPQRHGQPDLLPRSLLPPVRPADPGKPLGGPQAAL